MQKSARRAIWKGIEAPTTRQIQPPRRLPGSSGSSGPEPPQTPPKSGEEEATATAAAVNAEANSDPRGGRIGDLLRVRLL